VMCATCEGKAHLYSNKCASGTQIHAADLMLLAHAPAELVIRRYYRLVVGSGDGIFVDRAIAARAGGVGVAVVARADGCSTRFRRRSFPVLDFEIEDLHSVDPRLELAA